MNTRACETCGCSVPEKTWYQHTRGKQHNSIRFYGERNWSVDDIIIRAAGGAIERRIRPHEVPDRLVACARRARELVLSRELVKHSGLAMFQRSSQHFNPSYICSSLIGIEEHDALPALQSSAPCVTINAANVPSVAALAALVERSSLGGAPALHSLQVQLSQFLVTGSGPNQHTEAAMSAALCAFAEQLAVCRCSDGVRVELHIGNALQQRRHVAMLVQRLARSLRVASALASLTLTTSEGLLRTEDVEAMTKAACDNWRERELSVLMGTSARGASPFRLLPVALVWHVLSLVADACRTQLHVSEGALSSLSGSGSSENAAAYDAPGPGGPGNDLDFVAMLMG